LTLTEGESKALLASSVLVLLAALGRVLLQPPAAQVQVAGLHSAGDVDSALAVAESVRTEEERRREPLAPGERIDPNAADEVELDRLPGVGPALARSIVVSRREGGRFRSLEDLERVQGLGSSKIGRLAPYTTLPETGGGRPAPGGEASRSSRADPQHKRLGRLDLNRATAEELVALPGIGPARASAIVRWRSEHGSFRNIEALLEVPGIGLATLERLRPLVITGP
jgi:competence ComEA-like helix-hairpin-helix protein